MCLGPGCGFTIGYLTGVHRHLRECPVAVLPEGFTPKGGGLLVVQPTQLALKMKDREKDEQQNYIGHREEDTESQDELRKETERKAILKQEQILAQKRYMEQLRQSILLGKVDLEDDGGQVSGAQEDQDDHKMEADEEPELLASDFLEKQENDSEEEQDQGQMLAQRLYLEELRRIHNMQEGDAPARQEEDESEDGDADDNQDIQENTCDINNSHSNYGNGQNGDGHGDSRCQEFDPNSEIRT